MTKQDLIQNVANNAKFTDFQVRETRKQYHEVGFKLSRKNSYVYFWFHVWNDDDAVFFSHSYSQKTGKMSYSYKKVRNLLWSIGYFG